MLWLEHILQSPHVGNLIPPVPVLMVFVGGVLGDAWDWMTSQGWGCISGSVRRGREMEAVTFVCFNLGCPCLTQWGALARCRQLLVPGSGLLGSGTGSFVTQILNLVTVTGGDTQGERSPNLVAL